MDNYTQSAPPAAKPQRPWVAILLLLAAIIYGILPVDAIPDVIPILGLGDDALVLLGSLIYFYKNFVKKQPAAEDSASGK
ncbi:MAG: YkvA family protein [Nitrospinota bacterium]|nr:YkvA family protein [Nitrospinota bacterium]